MPNQNASYIGKTNNNNNDDNNNNNNNNNTKVKSKQLEVYMGSNTENVIDILFNTLLQNFQRIQETSNEKESEFIPDGVEILEY